MIVDGRYFLESTEPPGKPVRYDVWRYAPPAPISWRADQSLSDFLLPMPRPIHVYSDTDESTARAVCKDLNHHA